MIKNLLQDTNNNSLQNFATLWKQFVLMLRNKWENMENLPGYIFYFIKKIKSFSFSDLEQPDLSKCLFHQKLQMIQFCISTKLKRQLNIQETSKNPIKDYSGDFSTYFQFFLDGLP